MKFNLSAGAFVGNLLWFIFGGGVFLALGWLFLGVIMCCTVIGLPFGMAAFRVAGFAAFPFGKELVDARMLGEQRIPGTALANLLWVILAGLWLAIGHALAGVFNLFGFFLVFPVFWAMANFKLAAASFAPLGKRAVPKAYAQALVQVYAQRQAGAVVADRTLPLHDSPAGIPPQPPSGLAGNRKFLVIALVAGGPLVFGIIAAVKLTSGTQEHSRAEHAAPDFNRDLRINRPGNVRANARQNSVAAINLNDLDETKRRICDVFEGWEEDEAQTARRTQGNELAAEKEIPRVHERNLRKLREEFAKLDGKAVVWRFTINQVLKDGFIAFNEAPTQGYVWPNDKNNPFFIWFGDAIEHAPGYLKIDRNLPRSTAELLRPGTVLVVRGTVRAVCTTGGWGPSERAWPANVSMAKVPLAVLISNTRVSVAE